MLQSMSYPGGKNGAGVYQKIISLMPPHDVYIEPFLGGGAVMRLKRPASLNIGCDLSVSAIAAFRDSAGGNFSFGEDRRLAIARTGDDRWNSEARTDSRWAVVFGRLNRDLL